MSDRQPHAPSGALRLPRDTTPTWEIELLISGATVFGLLQLPARLDTGMTFLIHRTAEDVTGLLLPLWLYLQFALLTLIGTFILHLCLRGYWVALVGLHSVYPQGIRWEAFRRTGPHLLEASRHGRDDVPALIEAADNRASKAFGVGVGMALVMLIPIALVLAAIVFVVLARGIVGIGQVEPMFGFWVLFGGTLLPFLAASVLDQAFGARWTLATRRGRLLRAVLGFYARIGFGKASNVPLALHTTHGGRSRGLLLVMTVMLPVLAAVMLLLAARIFDWEIGDHRGLPRFEPTGADVVLPRHYASQQARAPHLVPVPYLPDPVVRGPYLRLFVPYRSARHNHMVRTGCGDQAVDPGRAALDCFARLHAVAIDGTPLTDLRFDAAEDPVTGLRGMLAMIDVRGLAPGRHELSLLPPPSTRTRRSEKDPEPYRIPFWR